MNIFGLIVYTEEHPYIIKVLRDNDYWASLNAKTKNWILYAIKPDDDYSHLTKEYILPQLGINDSKELPLLVIVAIGLDRSFLQRSFQIDDKDENTAYRSIMEQVSIVTEAASRIIPEYRSSTNVHREAIKAIESELATKKWKKMTDAFVRLIKSLVGFI